MSPTPDSTSDDLHQIVADLQRKLDEALAREAAVADVLGVINSSPGNLQPVFEAILQKAVRLCGATYGNLLRYDGQLFSQAAAVHPDGQLAARVLSMKPFPPTSEGQLEQIVNGEEVNTVGNIEESAAYRFRAEFREMVDRSGFRSGLNVALRKEGALLGVISVLRKETGTFSDKQIALLQNFAAQAVIAMENARLINETREALEQQTATAEVLQVINASPGDLAPVFDAMLEKAFRLCDGVQGSLMTFDGGRPRLAAARGLSAEFVEVLQEEWERRGPSEQHPMSRLMRGERVVQILDLSVSDFYRTGDPTAVAGVELGRVRTVMFVALVKDDAPVGAFVIARREVRAFSDKQIALLQNFAAQAVIAMENARLLTETREALEQQTATAEVLQVINSSSGDLAPVFDAMLEKAMRLCQAAHGNLWTYDGQRFHPVAMHGNPRFTEWVRQRGPVPPASGTILERIVRGPRFVHIADVASDEVHAGAYSREAGEVSGARTLLVVPLQKDSALLGAMFAYRQEVRPFSDKQIALFQNFAAQAVIAMESARLLTETREALEQQTATAEVLGIINSSPGDLAPVFDAILEKAHKLCDVEFGTLQLYDGEKFRILTRRGFPENVGESWREPYSVAPNSPLGALLKGEPLAEISDVIAYQAQTPNPRAEAAIAVGIRGVLFLPLRHDNLLLGVISAGRREAKPFQAKEIALLQNFAAQAVIAMENARLLTETREALEQQTATAEVLGVINTSPGDLTPVFDAMLEKATRLCEAPFGTLRTWDGERFHFGAVHGDRQLGDWVRRRGSFRPDGGPLRRIMEGEQVVQIADASSDPVYSTSLGFREMVEASGMRSGIAVALRKDETLLGSIHVYRQEVRPFSDKQIALLQNFAAQAVIAMENARLLGELRSRTEEVAELNRGLEARVAEQVEELGRVGRLKRFLAPQLAELIVSQGDEKILESHRREIVVVFCDLRGYTAFTETAEPEEVLEFLRQYHGALGPLVTQFEGTLDQFSGDGIMVFFNDPVPCPDPAERAVKMAMAMREEAGKLIAGWRRHRRELGFGAGIAQGYATLGQIGFSDRSGYTAIGTVCNLAARLCAEAKDGQILVSSRIAEAVETVVRLEDLGDLELRGLRGPVAAFNVGQSDSAADARPNLTVVARGPGA